MAQGTGAPDGGQGAPPDGGTKDPAVQAPPAGQGGGTTPPDGGNGPGSDDAARVIARVNAEAKEWREKYEAAQSKLTEHERSQMSDLEQVNSRLTESEQARSEAESRAQELTVELHGRDAAAKAKAVDPGLVARLIPRSAINYDKDGKPTNLDALVAEIKKDHALLFASARGSADGGPRGESAASGDMNDLIRRGARRG